MFCLFWTCCISWHSHPHNPSCDCCHGKATAALGNLLAELWGFAMAGVKAGSGCRVPVGIPVFYRLQWRQTFLGKSNKPVSLCALESPLVGQRWPFNLPQCIEVTSTGFQGRRTETFKANGFFFFEVATSIETKTNREWDHDMAEDEFMMLGLKDYCWQEVVNTGLCIFSICTHRNFIDKNVHDKGLHWKYKTEFILKS